MFFNKNCHHFHIFFKFRCFCQLFLKEFEKTLKNPGFFKIHLKKTDKTRLEKNRFLLPGFFGFFQMVFEKTRVFSGFFKFFGKKLTKTAKFEKKMKMEAFFIKKHVFWVGMAQYY